METVKKIKKINKNKQFKSYYVVWKLTNNEKKEIEKFEFKSYYVVWKLF